MLKEYIQNEKLRARVTSPEEAARCIQNSHTVAMGGYTNSGYPKVVAGELAKRRQSGEALAIQLLTGSSVGPEIDETLARAGILSRRSPMHESRAVAGLANQGALHYVEAQLARMPRLLAGGAFGPIDVAVVEALGITEEGYLVPSASIGMTPHFLKHATSVVVEINTVQPQELRHIHDVYEPVAGEPVPLTAVNQRIGHSYLRLDPRKIVAIVESSVPDVLPAKQAVGKDVEEATRHLLNFLELEYPNKILPPVQTGIGNIADGITGALGESCFSNLEFFCGGIQEKNLELFAAGRLRAVSTGSVAVTRQNVNILRQYANEFRKTYVMRNSDVTNSAEVAGRLGIIAINSAIEVDMYGNANTSHRFGTHVVNGIGGGAGFAQNAALSILVVPSVRKNGAISCVVPMVSHQDIGEHDVDVIVTENGVADLRGKDDVERARAMIDCCVHPAYKERLNHYLQCAVKSVGGHHPQLLDEAFSWHIRLKETGSMLPDSVFQI